MVDIVELRTASHKLRQWACEIRRENTPPPFAGADEDIRMLERAAALLREAADALAEHQGVGADMAPKPQP